MKQFELALEDLPDRLAQALTYWRDQGGQTLTCSWRDFDLLSLPSSLLPSTLVIDVYPDMDLNRYRYWGTRMTAVHGYDMTGLCPYDVEPEELAAVIRRQHKRTMEEKVPSADFFEFERSNGVIQTHKTLRLPLSNDGRTVSQIVILIDLTEERVSHSHPSE